MQNLEKDVFGGENDRLILFVIQMWEGFVKWAYGIVTASEVLYRHEKTNETAQFVVDANGTRLAIEFGAKVFQKRLGEDTTIGLAYSELFKFQDLIIPLTKLWYEKFGEYGVFIDAINTETGQRLPFHEDAIAIVNEFLNDAK